jgi:hypothetical protein
MWHEKAWGMKKGEKHCASPLFCFGLPRLDQKLIRAPIRIV